MKNVKVGDVWDTRYVQWVEECSFGLNRPADLVYFDQLTKTNVLSTIKDFEEEVEELKVRNGIAIGDFYTCTNIDCTGHTNTYKVLGFEIRDYLTLAIVEFKFRGIGDPQKTKQLLFHLKENCTRAEAT